MAAKQAAPLPQLALCGMAAKQRLLWNPVLRFVPVLRCRRLRVRVSFRGAIPHRELAEATFAPLSEVLHGAANAALVRDFACE